jgi:hypothetical protein
MYTQCKIQFEPLDEEVQEIDVVWIPSKFAKIGKRIILDKPYKRRAVVLEVYGNQEKVERKSWNNNI